MNKRVKDILEKLKKPSVVFSIIFVVLTIAVIAVTLTLLVLGYDNIFMYMLYAVAALTLAYSVYIVVICAPKWRNSIISLLKKTKLTNEMLENFGYRKFVFAILSFLFNIAYALFQAVIAILSRSVWLGALAVYYIALCAIRGRVVTLCAKARGADEEQKALKQIKTYRNCGGYLIVLNFALVVALVQMIWTDSGFVYAGLMIYVMATYAFSKLTMSILHIVKATKINDYAIRSITAIAFADSLVSILALQTAMFAEFAVGTNVTVFNILTGSAVSFAIIGVGVYMLINGIKKLKQLKEEKNNG